MFRRTNYTNTDNRFILITDTSLIIQILNKVYISSISFNCVVNETLRLYTVIIMNIKNSATASIAHRESVLYSEAFPCRINPAHDCQNFTTQDSTQTLTHHHPVQTLNTCAKALLPKTQPKFPCSCSSQHAGVICGR